MKLNIDFIYPVGSIYMSVNATNPSTLFGGTWTQLKDRFLLGAGSTYTNGATGGEATHKLTTDEMPSHSHNLSGWYHTFGTRAGHQSGGDFVFNDEASTISSAGGNQAHNNMPPYLVVYMWKRTA